MWNEEMERAYGEMEVAFSHPQIFVIGAFTVALYILEYIWFSKMTDKNKAAWDRKKEEAIAAGKTAPASKKSQSYDRDSHDDHTVCFNLLRPVLFIFPIACTYFVLKILGIDMEWLASI